MRLLVLGGTAFLGRHFVEAALRHGHEVTLFNRGKRNPGLFPGVETLIGDRDGGLAALEGRKWDAAVDTCGYVPRIVRDSVTLLRNAVEHYTFVSSVSVYAGFTEWGQNENAPIGTLSDPTVEEVTGETYGPLKALCEKEALAAMPGRALIVRPGLIVGPHDPTDRFTYWAARAAEGGDILAPEPRDNPVQVIDVRDLAQWMLLMAEDCAAGVYNTVGPRDPLCFEQMVEGCIAATGSDGRTVWADEPFLNGQGIELPMWVPQSMPEWIGIDAIDGSRAVEMGLRHRPFEQTAADTAAWAKLRPADYQWRTGPTRDKETLALAALRGVM